MTSVTAPTTETTHPVDQVLPFLQMFIYGLQHRRSRRCCGSRRGPAVTRADD